MAVAGYIKRQHARLRRPIVPGEVPHLERLASELRALRDAAALTRPELAALSGVSVETIKSVELAKSRTRRTTLARVSHGLVHAQPQLGLAEAILAQLVRAAGRALAGESMYSDRVESRRLRRARKGGYLPRGSRRLLVVGIERPVGGESQKSFLARMEGLERGGWCCLDCGKAMIPLPGASDGSGGAGRRRARMVEARLT
jgi:transcriptional regulator with XRE-family HTH domain